MKKLFKYIFLIACIGIFDVVKAEDYSLDANGNYFVDEAVCVYKINSKGYDDRKYEIRVNNAKISAVREYYNNKIQDYNDEQAFRDLSYINFFSNKKFSCFENVFINVYGVGETPMSLRVSKIEINPNYQKATWISEGSYIKYKKASNKEENNSKEVTTRCYYTKQTLNSAGSNVQAKAPQNLTYMKYSDGSDNFVGSNNNVYKLTSDSNHIDKCDIDNNLQLFIKIVNNKYKIVDKCSDSSSDCVIYVLAAYNGKGDSELKPDGTSPNDTQLVDPDEVPELNTDLPDDIDTCGSLLGDPNTPGSPASYIVIAFDVIKYVALVLMIVLSVMDFTGAVAKQDKDVMSKILKKIMMRFILCIIIFLLPWLVKLLLKYFVERQTDLCGM